jgi:hypothetical protein
MTGIHDDLIYANLKDDDFIEPCEDTSKVWRRTRLEIQESIVNRAVVLKLKTVILLT